MSVASAHQSSEDALQAKLDRLLELTEEIRDAVRGRRPGLVDDNKSYASSKDVLAGRPQFTNHVADDLSFQRQGVVLASEDSVT